MSTRCHASRTAGQLSLWPVEAASNTPAPGSCTGTESETVKNEASTRQRRTPSFVCEVPLRVGPAEDRVLEARLLAARALYNACLGEARKRWFLVKQSKAYQHARTLPRKTP
jgi:hypothetical protein